MPDGIHTARLSSESDCRVCGGPLAGRRSAWLSLCRDCYNVYQRDRRRRLSGNRDTAVCYRCLERKPRSMFKPDDSPDGISATCLDCIPGPGRAKKRSPAEWMSDPPTGTYIADKSPPPRSAESGYWQMMDLCEAAEAKIKAAGPSDAELDAKRDQLDYLTADIGTAKNTLKALLVEIVAARKELARLKKILRSVEVNG